ncbi:hypothetical protein HDV63DRAFT_361604 [Trichoderma sp. SZMC 28014]
MVFTQEKKKISLLHCGTNPLSLRSAKLNGKKLFIRTRFKRKKKRNTCRFGSQPGKREEGANSACMAWHGMSNRLCVRVRGGAMLVHISCMSLPGALVLQHIMLSPVSHILAVLYFCLLNLYSLSFVASLACLFSQLPRVSTTHKETVWACETT